MPREDSSDFEKLSKALSALASSFSSVDDVLGAFGLRDLPPAHRYGIMFGFITFTCTVIAVVALLVLGGSFKRIAEQSSNDNATIPDSAQIRTTRPLLLERLIEARDRMMEENYPPPSFHKGLTKLAHMLLNVDYKNVEDLVDEDDGPKKQHYVPPGYQENYVAAYRKCQDKSGGAVLSGRPESRYEAYARAYAGCGIHTAPSYRRSYARMYEAVACQSHKSDDTFRQRFEARPQDVVGANIRLEALDNDRHLQDLFHLTCGDAYFENQSYEPNAVWGFMSCGPFRSAEELSQSEIFQRQANEAAFAIVNNVTDRVVGAIILTNDDPKNLTIQMEPPLINPVSEGAIEQMEACFLVLDRLFALGYRRVQLSLDTQDAVNRRLSRRLGFAHEGVLPKHMVVKDANRDSAIYGILNSDWDKGARAALFTKLYGAKMQRADEANNAKEGELDEQQRVLSDRKAQEEATEGKKNK